MGTHKQHLSISELGLNVLKNNWMNIMRSGSHVKVITHQWDFYVQVLLLHSMCLQVLEDRNKDPESTAQPGP